MKTKKQTPKSETSLNGFKKIFNFEKKIDYVKYKNIFLIAFSAIFAAIIAMFAIWFSLADSPSYNSTTRTIVEIPSLTLSEEDLDSSELNNMKDVATEILEKECTVQLSTTANDLYIPKEGRLTITIFEEIDKTNEVFKNNLNKLINTLKENHPKIINISNVEEIMVLKQETADVDDYEDYSLVFMVCAILILISVYFIINFKKLNGFLVALSFIFTLILNFSIISGLFLALINVLDYNINRTLIFSLIFTIIFSSLNLIFNINFIFNKVKNLIEKEEKRDVLISTMANNAINHEIKNVFNNFNVYVALPALLVLVGGVVSSFLSNFKILANIAPFLVVFIVSGIVSFLTSILGPLQLWLTLKRKNKAKIKTKTKTA